MKIVVQRVLNANLKIDGKLVSSIQKGLVAFVGFGENDETPNLNWFANKLAGLRIFEDEQGKMNLNVSQIDGEILVVPNFTLYANCMHGFRPSFIGALNPQKAIVKFNEFVKVLNQILPNKIKTGVFGADMKINQTNDGPITIIIEN